MGGSSMPKTDYDLVDIMYSAYDMHHILCNIDGNSPAIVRKTAWDVFVGIA